MSDRTEETDDIALDAPGPGIYHGIDLEEYLAWPYISNSSLRAAERSMLHYYMQEPVEETDAMRFGSFCHLGQLEPSAIFRRYVVMPDLTAGIRTANGKEAKSPKATSEYKERVEDWTSRHAAGKLVVEQEEFDRMVGILSALDQHDVAGPWFRATGPTEVSIVWDDLETGLRCKGRIDKWRQDLQLVIDLKTCADGMRFANNIATYRMYQQGAMYCDGLMVLTGEIYRFALVAVEKEHPYGVQAAPVAEHVLEEGRELYKSLLHQIAECRASNRWPGYQSPAQWELPAWASKQSEPITLVIEGQQVTL